MTVFFSFIIIFYYFSAQLTALSDIALQSVTLALQFNSHKPVQKLFHNLHIIFTNSLMGYKVICQFEKEPLKGLANVQEIFS